jgi:hypothetical protein
MTSGILTVAADLLAALLQGENRRWVAFAREKMNTDQSQARFRDPVLRRQRKISRAKR